MKKNSLGRSRRASGKLTFQNDTIENRGEKKKSQSRYGHQQKIAGATKLVV